MRTNPRQTEAEAVLEMVRYYGDGRLFVDRLADDSAWTMRYGSNIADEAATWTDDDPSYSFTAHDGLPGVYAIDEDGDITDLPIIFPLSEAEEWIERAKAQR